MSGEGGKGHSLVGEAVMTTGVIGWRGNVRPVGGEGRRICPEGHPGPGTQKGRSWGKGRTSLNGGGGGEVAIRKKRGGGENGSEEGGKMCPNIWRGGKKTGFPCDKRDKHM